MIKTIFTKYLFFVILTYVVVIIYFSDFSTYGINKTVGWAYDITNLNFLIGTKFSISIIIFLIGYGVIIIFKRKTVFIISLSHFIIILISMYFEKAQLNVFALLLFIISINLFVINLIKAYK